MADETNKQPPVDEPGSVSLWIQQLKDGDRDAVQELWGRYFHRLVGIAHNNLKNKPVVIEDGEDVAVNAFNSFCLRAEAGQFPDLADRDGLWDLLAIITVRKAAKLIESEERQRRDMWKTQHGLSTPSGDSDGDPLLVRMIGHEPDPAFAAEISENCRVLLQELEDDELRTIAVRKMEGHTNKAIAKMLDIAESSVERRLGRIRMTWSQYSADAE